MNLDLQNLKLLCDNKACDFEVPEVDPEKSKEFIGKPCPKCGQDLLSLEDYENLQAINTAQMILNSLGAPRLLYLIDALNLVRETVDIQEAVSMGSNGRQKAVVHYQLHGRMGIKKIDLIKAKSQNKNGKLKL